MMSLSNVPCLVVPHVELVPHLDTVQNRGTPERTEL